MIGRRLLIVGMLKGPEIGLFGTRTSTTDVKPALCYLEFSSSQSQAKPCRTSFQKRLALSLLGHPLLIELELSRGSSRYVPPYYTL